MNAAFAERARRLLALPVAVPAAGGQGGYGPDGEAIYTTQPMGCPTVLVDSRAGAKAVFMSNGSVEFAVQGAGLDVTVLRGQQRRSLPLGRAHGPAAAGLC